MQTRETFISVLNCGHVEYVDHMGSDLSVVNAARVSFNKASDWEGEPHWSGNTPRKLQPRDEKLKAYRDWETGPEGVMDFGSAEGAECGHAFRGGGVS